MAVTHEEADSIIILQIAQVTASSFFRGDIFDQACWPLNSLLG